ncbi:MAG: DUF1674 domain-containing protein [Alphaproteobacteria bacterium]|nr:DUF1674 domain-containing protein [Alphaproteobacteria bacterium]
MANQATPEQVAARIAEAAQRAKAEAEARRTQETKVQLPPELGGPKGPEPTRYGDWEIKGIVSDF